MFITKSITMNDNVYENNEDGTGFDYICQSEITFSYTVDTEKTAPENGSFEIDLSQRVVVGKSGRTRKIHSINLTPTDARELAMFILNSIQPNKPT